MDPEIRELARAAVEALQTMAANSSNRLGDVVGLIQCGLIGYGLWIMQKGNADRAEQVKYQQQYQERQDAALEQQGTALEQQSAALEQQGTALERQSAALERQSAALERQGAALERQGAALADIGAGIQELLRDRRRQPDS